MTATPDRADAGGSVPRDAVTKRDKVMIACIVVVTNKTE